VGSAAENFEGSGSGFNSTGVDRQLSWLSSSGGAPHNCFQGRIGYSEHFNTCQSSEWVDTLEFSNVLIVEREYPHILVNSVFS
jgi:hypothetical protein